MRLKFLGRNHKKTGEPFQVHLLVVNFKFCRRIFVRQEFYGAAYFFFGTGITSQPMYLRKTSGTMTLPSACW